MWWADLDGREIGHLKYKFCTKNQGKYSGTLRQHQFLASMKIELVAKLMLYWGLTFFIPDYFTFHYFLSNHHILYYKEAVDKETNKNYDSSTKIEPHLNFNSIFIHYQVLWNGQILWALYWGLINKDKE